MLVSDLREAVEADEVYRDIPTLAQVLEWLPPHIAADFDCPDHGPHEWVEITAHDVTWIFCKYCSRKKVIRPWVDTRLLAAPVPVTFWRG